MIENKFSSVGNKKSSQKKFWDYITRSNFGIFKKFLFAFLVVSLIPLSAFGIYTLIKINDVKNDIVNHTTLNIDQKTQETMELQAEVIANNVEKFLRARENDLNTLSNLQPTEKNYQRFSEFHNSEIWIRSGTKLKPTEERKIIPLYKEVAFIDAGGNEVIKIMHNKISRNLRNVRIPKNTTYLNETYFDETAQLENGDIFVSHLTGFYVSKKEQLKNTNEIEFAVEGKKYDGVIRFAKPVYINKKFVGIVMIALDHQHLMEFTQHVLPNKKAYTVFPIYKSGNYAFMFDDEGWIITHPKLWDIRGVDSIGNWVSPFTQNSSDEDIKNGRIPFNLDKVGFIHKNYPFVAKQVRLQKSGSSIAKNVGGVQKIMSYAPIFYDRGSYKKYGIFGGITVGSNIELFHTQANLIATEMNTAIRFFINNILLIILITFLFVVISSWMVSRNFTHPILKITDGAQKLAEGKLDNVVEINRNDEIGFLANTFNYMSVELKNKNEELINYLNQIKKSKTNIEIYAKDLEYQLKIFKSIQNISNILGSTFNMNKVLKLILQNCVESVGFDRAILYLIDDKDKYLVCRETFGFSEAEEKLAKNSMYNLKHFDCIETRVVKEQKIIFVESFRRYNEATELDKKIRRISGSKSFVFVPLKVKEKIIGILGADKLIKKTKINELDINSLQILSNQASRVIENTRLVQEIIQQKNFNENILKFMLNGILTTDINGIITTINKAAINILELKKDEIVGKSISEVLKYNQILIDEIKNKLQSKGFYREYDIELNLKDKIKFINITASLMSEVEGINSGAIIILQDTTEKRNLDEQIRTMDRLATLGRFAAGIAHEIRNPLTGISLFLDDLHDRTASNLEISKFIQLGLKEVERIESFVNELLDYSSASKHKVTLKSINSLIETSLPFIYKQCKNSNIIINKTLSPALPELLMDSEKVRQALLNIMINSIQAMQISGQLDIETALVERSEYQIFSSIENEYNSDWIKIIISDSGPGIPFFNREKIFEPFYTKREGGTGLGLSITHSIITEHKGKITAGESIYGGAMFTIFLPVLNNEVLEIITDK